MIPIGIFGRSYSDSETPSDYTSNLFWEGDEGGGTAYTWETDHWQAGDGFVQMLVVTTDVGSAHYGWQENFRPAKVHIDIAIDNPADFTAEFYLQDASLNDLAAFTVDWSTESDGVRVAEIDFISDDAGGAYDIANLSFFLTEEQFGNGPNISSINFTGAALDRTSDAYWDDSLSGYAWTGVYWDENDGPSSNLRARTSGGSAGWQTGFRPDSVTLHLRTGSTGGPTFTPTDAHFSVIDTNNTEIGTATATFDAIDQIQKLNIALTFGSYDIKEITVSSFVYTHTRGVLIDRVVFKVD